MNNTEFLQESQNYISDCYRDFTQYQNVVKDIFQEFHRLCGKNHIRYFVSYGSLLGVVRDKGFIPWDYDMDVIVSIEDREKLIQALNRDLSSDYYYAYTNVMRDYPLQVLRVCKKGYTYMSIHVDVFFMIGCPDDADKRKRFIQRINRLFELRCTKFAARHSVPQSDTLARRVFTAIMGLKAKLTPVALLEKLEESLYHKYPVNESEVTTILDAMYYELDASIYKETIMVECDGIEYAISPKYEKALEDVYGDFRTYLPIQDRFEEFYKLYHTVKNNQKFFQETLEKQRAAQIYKAR